MPEYKCDRGQQQSDCLQKQCVFRLMTFQCFDMIDW